MTGAGRLLVVCGLVIMATGFLLMFAPKVPFIGKLPGDLHFKRENFEVYIPLTTSLLLSLVLSGIVWIINYFSHK